MAKWIDELLKDPTNENLKQAILKIFDVIESGTSKGVDLSGLASTDDLNKVREALATFISETKAKIVELENEISKLKEALTKVVETQKLILDKIEKSP